MSLSNIMNVLYATVVYKNTLFKFVQLFTIAIRLDDIGIKQNDLMICLCNLFIYAILSTTISQHTAIIL